MLCDLKLSSCICLPSLEELNLSHVKLIGNGSTHDLLSGPALKRLSISLCKWNIGSRIIHAPKLLSLSIDESEDCKDYSEAEITIFSPSLEFFSYLGSFYTGFCIHGSPQLVEAKIYSTFSNYDSPQTERLVELLKGLVCVKGLTLYYGCPQIMRTGNRLLGCLPEFGNVTNLDINISNTYWEDRAFLQILEKCPYLTTLNLKEANSFCLYSQFDKSILDLVPSCFGLYLKKITIRYSDLCPVDLAYVSIFLEKAKVLEEMVIYCKQPLYFGRKKKIDSKKEFLKRLQELPKGSKHCKISLV